MISPEPLKITSRHNARFKQWLRYATHPEEEECPWVAVEGRKQIGELARRHPIELLCCSDAGGLDPALRSRVRELVELPQHLLQFLSAVQTPQDLVAFFRKPKWGWPDIGAWVLYLERLQDPGNLGTLLRTARATGLFALVSSPATVSFYHAKVVRASSTALFDTPFLQGIAAVELQQRGYTCWAAQPGCENSLFRTEFEPPVAFAVGSEGQGLSPETLQICRPLAIPMAADSESLNAAVAGSLIIYEIYRRKESL